MKRLTTLMLLVTMLFVFSGASKAVNNTAPIDVKITVENSTARYENPLKDFAPSYKGKMLTKSQRNPDIIKLGYFSIDVNKGEPKLNPEFLTKNTKDTYDYYIIGFTGKMQDSYKDAIKALGADIEWPLKNSAVLARVDNDRIDEIRDLAAVNWVSSYHPAYKFSPKWAESKAADAKELVLKLHKTGDFDRVIEQLNSMGIEITETSGANSAYKVIAIRASLSQAAELAKLKDVFAISARYKYYPHNDDGRSIMMESSTTPADTTLWEHGIYGAGEIVNVTDSGIEIGHYAFYDNSVALNTWGLYPSHRKVIAYYPTVWDWIDAGYVLFGDESNSSYHGTHTSGTVAGNDAPFATSPYDGIAKDAKLFFMDCGDDTSDWLWIPVDNYSMYDTMYAHGARISSNSYGGYNDTIAGAYMDGSQNLDAFTWDHKDFTLFYSAGNDGTQSQTISPTPSAKNVVAVGAHSESSPNSQANFSSEGPTTDGRWGITIMAPGVGVTSARGGTTGGSSDYWSMDGTSMSCPFSAGATALIRDWLKQGFYPTGTAQPGNAVTNPSSALLRALIINSGEDMGQTIPNTTIGFGRYTLFNVTFMNDVSPKAIALHDAQDGLLQDEYVEYQFNVTDGSSDLKASLVWTDYPYPFIGYNQNASAENAMTDSVLMNDLDLILISPSNTTYDLNDVINPMEQHTIASPETGVWTVRVVASEILVSPQPYALVVTYNVNNAVNGSVTFDKAVYSAIDSVATITVADNSGGLSPSVDVMVYSMVGDTETVTCTGTTGLFTGSIDMGYDLNVIDDGRLAITGSDTIWAEYDDTDPIATLKAMATTDGRLFSIYNVHTENVGGTRAFIGWNTTEESTGKVYYGTTSSLGSETAVDPNLVKEHTGDFAIELSGLTSNTIYYYDVESTDHKGNTVRDDNAGNHYQFATVDMSGTDILVIVTDQDMQGELFAHPEFLVQAIEDGGWTYSWWQTSVNNFGQIPVDNLMKNYKAIFLQSGQENYPPINKAQQDSIERYEEGGGRIAFTGHDFGWAMASSAGFSSIGTDAADSIFIIDYLMGRYDGDIIAVGDVNIDGVTGDPISGSYTGGVNYSPYRDGAGGDSLTGVSNAFVNGTSNDVWLWTDGYPMGVRWESGNTLGTSGDGVWGGYRTRVVYNAFEITQMGDTSIVDDPVRSDILNNDLIWLIGHDHPDITLSAPTGGETFSSSPITIQWTASADGASGAYIDSVFLYYSPNGGDVWYEIDKGTAAQVTSPYSWDVSGLLNGNNYIVKVKVKDGGVLPSMGGFDASTEFTINITGNDTEGPMVYAGSVRPSHDPVGNYAGYEPSNTVTITAVVCDSMTGMSAIAGAEWSYGLTPASAGTGTAMTAVDGAFDEMYEEVTATFTVDETWSLGEVDIWVRGQDASPSKSPSNWGTAESTTITVLNTRQYTGVKLVSLIASTEDGAVTLKWRTAEENNNAYFIVERSTSKDNGFKEIGRVAAKTGSEYSYTDNSVFGGEKYYYRLVDVSTAGETVTHPVISVLANGKPRPTTFMISQNYPNPFSGTTMIEYAVPVSGRVDLAVYDVTGKLVRTLVNDNQNVNYYRVAWDGRDNAGKLVASGVYFYKLTSGAFDKSMKMMYLK